MKTVISLILVAFFLSSCRSQQQTGADTVTLENTRWRLTEVNDKQVETPLGGREVYMVLTREGDEGRISGFAGCNGLGGSFQTDGATIKFQPITTRMFCELQMAVENAFTEMLTSANNYRINGQSLELYRGSQLLGRFGV